MDEGGRRRPRPSGNHAKAVPCRGIPYTEILVLRTCEHSVRRYTVRHGFGRPVRVAIKNIMKNRDSFRLKTNCNKIDS